MEEMSHAALPGALDALKWRCIGPPRGGRVVAVAGDPVHPMVCYFGACAGGIWKSIDGASTGATCPTDSDQRRGRRNRRLPAPIQRNLCRHRRDRIRLDVSYGDGVYKSSDAGRTWSHVGLRNSKHIGRICIHPTNPDIVYVAALGDIFGPHEERGVFRSRDGGRSWEKVLYRDADTGAIELSLDASNHASCSPAVQVRRNFWNISSGGPGCGIFRSTDGGDTWEEITRAPGLPDGPLGKIGVTISPARTAAPGR